LIQRNGHILVLQSVHALLEFQITVFRIIVFVITFSE